MTNDQPPSRPGKRERTRALIIETATELYKEHDWDELTMDGIAEEAGLVKATLFNHFEGKNGLLIDVQLRLLGELNERLNEALDSEDQEATPLKRALNRGRTTRIRRYLDLIREFLLANEQLSRQLWTAYTTANIDFEQLFQSPTDERWEPLNYIVRVITFIIELEYNPRKKDAPAEVFARALVLPLLYTVALQRQTSTYELLVDFISRESNSTALGTAPGPGAGLPRQPDADPSLPRR